MRIGVLGPLEVDEGSAGLGTRDRVVLTAMAMSPGEFLTPERLADAVWGPQPPASWAKNVQGCISRLRKRVGADAIETSAHGYRLRVSGDSVDAVAFVQAARRARELMILREFEHARYVAAKALELWRGRPLADLEGWEAGVVEAGRLCEVRDELEELALEASLAAGHHREVLAQAAAMVEAAPLRERRWALLARAQYQAGDQHEALLTLRRVRTVLLRELGLDPGPDLVALEQAILRQDPGLLVEGAVEANDDVSPYLGLAPYEETDAESFFGREAEVLACLDRLRTVGLLAIVGPSGCGKSSLLRAGVLPALRRDGADVRVLTPGKHPMDALTAARMHPRSCLLVDQAEEAFTLCTSDDERARFFAALVEHAAVRTVVLTLRADYTGAVAEQPDLAPLVERGLVLLPPMSPASLRAAIEGPARLHGLVLEPGLVDLLVREVEGEPGALPLLSHSLRETWLRHEGRTLTVAGYQESGGIRGAVAQSAEHLYGELRDRERAQLRELVLRLVVPGAEGEPVRSRVPRPQVVAAPDGDRLIDLMVAARLVTSDDGVVQLAHEALVRAWPRLQGWLEDDRSGLRIRHRLTQAAADWVTLGHPDSELFRGARLAGTREWVTAARPQLTQDEQRFLTASIKLAEAEERSAADLAQARGRMVRRLRAALAGAAVLLVVALVAGFLATGQARRANRAATAADADRIGAQALSTSDITGSLLMAAAGARLDPSPETAQNLDAALAQRPELIDSATVPGRSALSGLDVSPTGRAVAVADRSHHVWTYDARTLDPVSDTQVGGSQPSNFDTPLAYDPTGHSLAIGTAPARNGLVRLLDPSTLEPLPHQLEGWLRRRAQVVGLSYSGDGRSLAVILTLPNGPEGSASRSGASAVETGAAAVWNLRDPMQAPHWIRLPTNLYGPIALSPQGQILYFAGTKSAYDVRTGRWLYRHGAAAYSTSVTIDRSGRLLAGTFGNFSSPAVSLVDARTGRVLRRLTGYTGDMYQAAFSPDGTMLAATSDAGRVLVWEVGTGDLIASLDDGTQLADGLGWSPDGGTLFTTAADSREIHAWDLTGYREFVPQVRINYGYGVAGGILWSSPRGDTVAMGLNIAPVPGLWTINVTTGTTSRPKLTRHSSFSYTGGFSPDGRRFATGYQNGWVQVFTQTSARAAVQRHVTSRSVAQVAFTPDGRGLAVLDDTGGVRLLDATSLLPRGPEIHLPATRTWSLATGPDNRQAFVYGGPPDYRVGPDYPLAHRWWLVDLVNGKILRHGSVGITIEYAALSPRGNLVALGGEHGESELLDLTTGRPVAPPIAGNRGIDSWVVFNRDGSRFATASDAGDASLWDGRTGQLLATTTLPGQGNTVAGFRTNGTLTLATANGPVYHWDPTLSHALAFACQAAGRDLTSAEWTQMLPDQPYRTVCPNR